VTSERDFLRQISRMPSQEYRLWEENIVHEEGSTVSTVNKDAIDVDDYFYEDFVIIEKLDMKKYNVKTKIHEEEKIKDSGKS
jgi:hypothetical protein